ncbi:MAG: hypothetical protein R2733_26175 [Acidimicrobiales bacterium]
MTFSAPPIGSGEWLTTGPLGPAHLAGRVSIIVFFSISSEASWVRLRQLEDLSADIGDTLAIIAVHSPRHPAERDVEAVNRVLDRAGVTFPVVHDPDLTTWARYSPGGWPSTVVIDHKGKILGISQGVDDLDVLFEAVSLAESLAVAERPTPDADHLRPLPTPTPNRRSTDRGLSWPGGLCLLSNGRVAIADSGNDRVLIVELDAAATTARVRRIHGGFDRPSQVCELPDGSLAVSEPKNGRVMRLVQDELSLANGVEPEVLVDGFLRPRGLTVDADGSLVIADAGADQLFRRRADGTLGPIAGSGRTGCADGPAGRADLAQPIAVTRAERGLTFLDVASSSLRLLTDDGAIHTVTGGRLDQAGLVDGPADSAVLDRPMALATLADGSVAIADTGNHRLRVLRNRKLTTLGVAGLDQPEAIIEFDEGLLLVADAGNHRIVMVDLESHRVWAVAIDEPERRSGRASTGSSITGSADSTVLIEHPTPGPGPWRVSISSSPDHLLACPLRVVRSTAGDPVSVRLGEPGRGRIAVHVAGKDPATARVQVRHLTVLDR